MNYLFKAKCIDASSSFLQKDQEYEVYKMDVAVYGPDNNAIEYMFLVLTPQGFRTYRANRFTYVTKLEQSLT